MASILLKISLLGLWASAPVVSGKKVCQHISSCNATEQAIILAAAAGSTMGTTPDPATTSNPTTTSTTSDPECAASKNTYDYIIVGGGLTGLVVANRLTENANVSVLVVEYGSFARNNKTTVPYEATTGLDQAHMFNITSQKEPSMGNYTFGVTAGAVVGGSTIVNGMEFDRASAGDYDSWELLGNPGWGWAGLFPYFKKSTTFTPPTAEIAAKYNYTYDASAYGTDGPLQVSYPPFVYPDAMTIFNGVVEAGVPRLIEGSLGNSMGAFNPLTALDPITRTRSDSMTAYYDPIVSRTNLELITSSQVFEIIFSDDLTATGVKYRSVGCKNSCSVVATKEVILAAGAIHTPHILQLSGIGPKAVVEAAGIVSKADLPGVGNNFQDHPTTYVFYNFTTPPFPMASDLTDNATFYAEQLALYNKHAEGVLTTARGNTAAWLSLPDITDAFASLLAAAKAQISTDHLPDVYASCTTLLAGFEAQKKILLAQFAKAEVATLEFPFAGTGMIGNSIQKPLSRGTISVNPVDPSGEPLVLNRALENPIDRELIGINMNFTRKVFAADAIQSLGPVELYPGAAAQTTEEIINVMLPLGLLSPTFAHPSCSCPMMPEAMGGVVSSQLLVYGTKQLSIVDASIMPLIPAAHLQATLYATSEKAADLIKARA